MTTIDNAAYYEPLTVFLYKLLRDEIPAGKLERLVQESVKSTEKIKDGSLLAHARGLASLFYVRLNDTSVPSLEHMSDEFADFNKVLNKMVSEGIDIDHEDLRDDKQSDLGAIEQEIVRLSKSGVLSESGVETEPIDIQQDIQNKIQEMIGKKIISEETATYIKDDVKTILTTRLISADEPPMNERSEESMLKSAGVDSNKLVVAEKSTEQKADPRAEFIEALKKRAEKMRQEQQPKYEEIERQLKEIDDADQQMEDAGLKNDYGTFVETWEQNNTNDMQKKDK